MTFWFYNDDMISVRSGRGTSCVNMACSGTSQFSFHLRTSTVELDVWVIHMFVLAVDTYSMIPLVAVITLYL